MSMWQATIEAWAFSTGSGRDKDKEAVAPRCRTYTFTAEGFERAVELTRAFQAGVQSQSAVWQARIKSLSEVAPD